MSTACSIELLGYYITIADPLVVASTFRTKRKKNNFKIAINS